MEIFKYAGLKTGEHDVKAGTIIKGNAVKKATGSDVLKGVWYNMTDNQKVSQIMFGIMYSAYHKLSAKNGAYAMNIDDFIEGFYIPVSGENFDNVRIPIRGGGVIPIDRMSFASSSVIGNPPLILYGIVGGKGFVRGDGSSFYSYHYECGRNMNATCRFTAITIAVPKSYYKEFEKTY